MKLNEVKQKIDNFFNNLTEDEIEKLKEKYFPKESNTPKGWVSIDERLPMLKAGDLFKGGTEYKVLFEDGVESYSRVTDPNTWYYLAKEIGITHWYNK